MSTLVDHCQEERPPLSGEGRRPAVREATVRGKSGEATCPERSERRTFVANTSFASPVGDLDELASGYEVGSARCLRREAFLLVAPDHVAA